jgi:RNA polymerase sigma-70 factor (ECF subfamily)
MSSSTVLRGLLSARAAPKNAGENSCETSTKTHELADEAVIHRVQCGDKQALGLLFDRYSRLVLSIALRILRDTSEAQELVQDVFLYVFNKSQTFDASKSPLKTWLVQVTYSQAFNRRQYLLVRRFYDYCHIDEVVDSVSSGFSLEAQGQIGELRELLRNAFAQLNERQRLTLQLFFFEGYSLREISAQLTQSLGNTRNHYYRGLERLREIMKLVLTPAPYRKE